MIHVGVNKFYTPTAVAKCLMSIIPLKEVTSAIDICCGSWNLLQAVHNRWKSAQLVGVDLDTSAERNLIGGAHFILGDGRTFAYNYVSQRKFDLVVGNPPFGRLSTDKQYNKIFDLSSSNIRGLAKGRIETEMLIANASLVRDGGYLLIVMPSSVIEAESFQSVRKYLLTEFKVEYIIKLPDNTFGTSAIRSYALILKKCKHCSISYKVISAKIDWISNKKMRLSTKKNINSKELSKMWCLSLKLGAQKCSDHQIFRGVINSSYFSKDGIPVLHIAAPKLNGTQWVPGIRKFSSAKLQDNIPFAESGDIIIGRVGRSAGFWCKYSGPKLVISDCLIVVRSSDPDKTVRLLQKVSEGQRLTSILRGVTTSYLTQKDIASFIQNNM